MPMANCYYRGRLAPSPTGYLHLGHARTFWIAWKRARAAGGKLVFRNEDLDYQRSKPEFVSGMYEDLRWLGLEWDEGPDVGGPFAPYSQGERRSVYLEAWRTLRDRGLIYPCTCSRKDLERALSAPHEEPKSPWTVGALACAEESSSQPGPPDRAVFARSGAEPGAAALQPAIEDELPYPGTCRSKIAT